MPKRGRSGNRAKSSAAAAPAVSADEDEIAYVVEEVLDRRRNPVTGKTEYKLKWEGYSTEESTWEPVEHCTCEDLILEYEERIKKNSGGGAASKKATPAPAAPAAPAAATAGAAAKGGRTTRAATSRAAALSPPAEEEEEEEEEKEDGDDDDADADAEEDAKPANGSKHTASAGVPTCEWEADAESIHSVRRNRKNQLVAKIGWKNGKTSEALTDEVHMKAPIKLIKYYESHLRFTN